MLSLISKTPVKFEFSDGVQVTTVTIAQDEDTESITAKLQRVLELEQSQGLPVRQPGAALAAAVALPQFTPADRAAEDARLAGVKVNGWSEDAAAEGGLESLPEV